MHKFLILSPIFMFSINNLQAITSLNRTVNAHAEFKMKCSVLNEQDIDFGIIEKTNASGTISMLPGGIHGAIMNVPSGWNSSSFHAGQLLVYCYPNRNVTATQISNPINLVNTTDSNYSVNFTPTISVHPSNTVTGSTSNTITMQLDNTGMGRFLISGNLSVPANTPLGSYSNSFNVTVDF